MFSGGAELINVGVGGNVGEAMGVGAAGVAVGVGRTNGVTIVVGRSGLPSVPKVRETGSPSVVEAGTSPREQARIPNQSTMGGRRTLRESDLGSIQVTRSA